MNHVTTAKSDNCIYFSPREALRIYHLMLTRWAYFHGGFVSHCPKQVRAHTVALGQVLPCAGGLGAAVGLGVREDSLLLIFGTTHCGGCQGGDPGSQSPTTQKGALTSGSKRADPQEVTPHPQGSRTQGDVSLGDRDLAPLLTGTTLKGFPSSWAPAAQDRVVPPAPVGAAPGTPAEHPRGTRLGRPPAALLTCLCPKSSKSFPHPP